MKSENMTPSLPEGFVYLSDICPEAIEDIRYFTDNNYMGCPVDGYLSPRAILTIDAAKALKKAAQKAKCNGMRLKIYDCYRPQRAVDHFVRWAEDVADQKNKALYYPEVNKADVFELGFIAKRSGHSRGSTVDLTLIDENGAELDMGGRFDYFGELSHPDYTGVSTEQFQNRMLLREIMVSSGFVPLKEEWWHFTLKNEPFADRYFDFEVR